VKAPKFICAKCMAPYAKWPGAECRKCGASAFSILTLDQALAKELPLPAPLLKLLIKDSDVRYLTGIRAFDRILSYEGGAVPGTSIVIAAVPGGGKTTLLLSAAGFNAKHRSAMYASAEQDVTALNRLAAKLGVADRARLTLIACKSLDRLLAQIERVKPKFLVVDSANDLAEGSGTDAKSIVKTMHQLVEGTKMTVVIVSHVNAEHMVRGGPALTHKCDAVLMLMGEPKKSVMRELVADKNRLGDTTITTSLKMTAHGFVDVDARTDINRKLPAGAALGLVAGDILEAQAMLSPRTGDRRFMVNGLPSPHLRELVAIVENGGLELSSRNVTVRITESEHTKSPGMDAAIVAAILSAFTKVPLPQATVLSGELTLSGELRGEQPIDDAKRLKVRLLGKVGKPLIRTIVEDCREMEDEILRQAAAAAQPEFAPANDGE
jgi:DNA repair protein RadA/Sms